MSYDRTNTGTLNRNDRKEKDTHPDFRGSINIDGREYWLDGWVKTAGPGAKTPGSKFLSLRAKPKDAPKPAAVKAAVGADFVDDSEIPF